MFDNIVIFRNRQDGGPPIDTGMLAEALLFYGNVHLLINRGTLGALWNDLGADGVDRLLDRPEIRLSYLRQNFGTVGSDQGGLRNYNFTIFEIGGFGKLEAQQAGGLGASFRKIFGTLSDYEETHKPPDFLYVISPGRRRHGA